MARLNVKHFRYIDIGKRIMHAVIPEAVVHSAAFRIIRSWLFQGVLYMAYSEILFRIVVELILAVCLVYLLFGSPGFPSIAISLLLAHTIMWLFNAHFWALSLGGNRRMAKNKPDKIIRYFDALNQRLSNDSSIDGCVIFGSLTRGEFTENSDIDILLCKDDGISNMLFAYLVGIRERFIAFIHRIPIELYFYNINVFERLDAGELPMLIKDTSGNIKKSVKNTINYEEYPLDGQPFFKNIARNII